MKLTEAEKERLILCMTDVENVFDDFHQIVLIGEDRLDNDDDGEMEEKYHELVEEFVMECRNKLKNG